MKTSIKIAQQWVSSYTRSAHQLAGCYCSTFLFAFCVCNCVNIYACVIVKACCCLYIYAQCNNASTFSILGIFFFIAPLGLLFLPHSTFHCCAVVAFVCTKIPQPCLFLGLKIFLDIHEYVLMYEYMCVCISIFYPTILTLVLFFFASSNSLRYFEFRAVIEFYGMECSCCLFPGEITVDSQSTVNFVKVVLFVSVYKHIYMCACTYLNFHMDISLTVRFTVLILLL